MGIKFPGTDKGLLAFSLNFATKITLDATALGLTPVQTAAYQAAHDLFAEKLALVDPGVRNKVAVSEKNVSKDDLKDLARAYARIIDAQPNVSDSMKIDIGLTVRKPAQPIQPADEAPVVVVDSIVGRTVGLNIFQADGKTRSKPDNARSVMVYSYMGPEPVPDDITKFQVQGLCTRTRCKIEFPVTVPAGSKVWITAAWLSPRDASGPASSPISLYLGGGPNVQVG